MNTKAKRYNWSDKTRDRVLAKTGGVCYYCGRKLENENVLDWGGKVVAVQHYWNVDHMLPVSKGGTNDIENLAPACKGCNSFKGNMTVEEFILARAK